uniref:DRBM domain-containing protein n=1 Tax=Panagrellus redivivus TaxID=6233 RepID=A0A7E4V020_PANRE
MSDFYANKIALAPMVKGGRTPLRLLALKYGAELVYTEEIVDVKLLHSRRVVNDILGTVDYLNNTEVVLRIAKEEREKIVLQIGTNNAENAVGVLKKLQGDVAALDVNMGCPKPFSISGGMGAALLSKPESVKHILTALVANATIPISCKIRVLDEPSKTAEFVKMLESTGIQAFGIHGRRRDERPGDDNRISEIKEVVGLVKIPVIANGNSYLIKENADIEKFRTDTTASSVMIGRKALQNPSIFRKEGVLTMEEEISDFLDLACQYDESYTQTKYVVQRILGGQQEFDPRGRATVAAVNVIEICQAWGKEDVYIKWRDYRRRHSLKRKEGPLEDVDGIQTGAITFPAKRLKLKITPKLLLNTYCDEKYIARPKYSTSKRDSDHRFEGVVEIDGKKYSSNVSQPNIKMAEQVAALVAIIGLGIRERLPGDWEEQ